jgi:hypothetical protein
MTAEKYMFLKNTGLKVPVKAKDGYYNLKNKKYKINLLESIERLFIFHLYGDRNRAVVADWLRTFHDKNITPQDIDELIAIFIDEHPKEYTDDQPFENYPLCATEDGMNLPIPGHGCIISLENEKELMAIVCGYKKKSMPYLQGWFQNFRAIYGLNYWKPCKELQDFYLAESFLHQHGISTELMSDKEKKRGEDKFQISALCIFIIAIGFFTWFVIKDGFLVALFLAIIIGSAIWLAFQLIVGIGVVFNFIKL